MKKSELKQLIKEELINAINEGGSFTGNESREYNISPRIQSSSGGPTDTFKTPYIVIWLNGGSPIYIKLAKEPDNKILKKFADVLANELEGAIKNTLKFLPKDIKGKQMPAQSKKQQQFMGMVHAVQTGKLDPNKVTNKVKKTAKGMTKKAAKDFASTKHDNLPEKSKNEESLRNVIREIIIDILNEEYSIMTGKFINDLEKFLAS